MAVELRLWCLTTAFFVAPVLQLVLQVVLRPAEVAKLPTFADRREKAGIHFKHQSSPTKEKYLIETMGGGVVVFDFNNDEHLDIFFVNGGKLRDPMPPGARVERSQPEYFDQLYRNNGNGSFTDLTLKAGVSGPKEGSYGMGATAADFDNDGFTDLYVTCFGANILYRNKGDGTFQDVTERAGVAAGGWSASAGFFDFDNDGWVDLFVTRYLDWDLSKHVHCPIPLFVALRAYCPPTRFRPVTNLLYRNNGDGTFADISIPSGIGKVLGKGLGVAFNDYNQDALWIFALPTTRWLSFSSIIIVTAPSLSGVWNSD